MPRGIAKNPEEKSRKISEKHKGVKTPYLTEMNIQKNPMKNLASKNKMIETMKNNYKEGKMKPPIPKGSNYEDIFGLEKSNKIRKKISMNQDRTSKFGENNSAKRPEVREKIRLSKIGEKNPAWNNGSSLLPYDKNFNKAFKLLIKQRDGFLCIKCGMREEDSTKLFKRKLIIHHIDYNKLMSIPENCCALCVRCNAEVNFNRPHWTKFFQSLLSERYGYKYSENGEVILEVKNET
jgi:hypothetical protein